MPDMSENTDLSEKDILFVRTALYALKEDLMDLLKDEKAQASAQLNIDLIDSVQEKIQNREMQYSDDECRVMYVAALEMRDFMNRMLDDHSISEYDRDMALSTLHSANGMLRTLRKTLIANGINIDD